MSRNANSPSWQRYDTCSACSAWPGQACRRKREGGGGSGTSTNANPHRGRPYVSLRCATQNCNLPPHHPGLHMAATGESFAGYVRCNTPHPKKPHLRCQRAGHPIREQHGVLTEQGELVMWL